MLWSDDELKAGRLFPKREGRRPPLSPNRSKLLLKAVTSRFRIDPEDEDALAPVILSVNQLGVDLKSGKRYRRSLISS